jgi:peptidoglycan/xylan/chitin deacetylase (PgdA/CDA1 family)
MNGVSTRISGVFKNFFARILPDVWMTVHGEKSNSIYLTFDDGPHPNVTPKLLELLKASNAKATFFLVGTNVAAYPALVDQIIENGHSIGNHSYDHHHFHKLALQSQLDQIIATNNLIEKITGAKCKLFRAPGGRLSLRLLLKLIRLGITSVHWSRDSLDCKESSEQVIANLVNNPIKSRDVILLHDDHQNVLGITEYILKKYQSWQFEKIQAR